MKTRLSEYDVNKLRSAAKEINDILYDIPEGNFDLEKVRIGNHVKSDDYNDYTSHPVFGKDLPWEKTEMVNVDIDTQIPMKFGNPSSPFEGKVESWHNPDMNKSMVEPLEYYKVCYSPNDIKMVIAILKNEKEIIAGKIELIKIKKHVKMGLYQHLLLEMTQFLLVIYLNLILKSELVNEINLGKI